MRKNAKIKYIILFTAFVYTVVFSQYFINRQPLFEYEKQSVVALVAFSALFFLMCMLKYSPSQSGWGIFLVLYCLFIGLQLVFINMQPAYVPLFLPAVIIALMYRPYCGMAFHLMYCILYFYISNQTDLKMIVYWILTGIIFCFVTEFMTDLNGMINSGLIYIITYAIITILRLRYEDNKIDYFMMLPGLLQIFVTIMICFLVIVGKKFIDIRKKPSKSKYVNYCNEDFKPIAEMRDTSLRVFYHSLEVADLSAAAASAINADAMLARAGAMYHDIGKTMSSNYVKAGVLVAKEYNLPKEIIDIIEEHNGKIRKPASKEAAIVYLADTLASTRDYMMKTGNQKMDEKKIIDNIMMLRLDSEMLDESGLTLSDFREIKKTFIEIMCGNERK